MKEDSFEPLSAELREAIDAARGLPPLGSAAQESLRARVAAAAALPEVSVPSSAPSIGGKLAAVAIAGMIAGGGLGAWIGRATVEPRVVRVEVPVVREVIVTREVPVTPEAPVTPEVPAPAPVAAPAPPRPSAASFEEERAMIDAARASLARGDAPAALATLDRHRRRFAQGALAEERDGLNVIALARIDRDRAALAAEAFRRRYPHSLLLGAIERAVPPP